jgi:hypothetical protein
LNGNEKPLNVVRSEVDEISITIVEDNESKVEI